MVVNDSAWQGSEFVGSFAIGKVMIYLLKNYKRSQARPAPKISSTHNQHLCSIANRLCLIFSLL